MHTLWYKTWGGSGYDQGDSIAVDSVGNVYVTGFYNYTEGDAFLLKYSPNGNLLWQELWGGRGATRAWGLALDSTGNLYVTGYTNSSGAGGFDIFLLKVNAQSGALEWQRTWGGSGDDRAYGLAVDPSGYIYVTGYTTSFGAGSEDFVLLKFDSSGSLVWQRTWGGSGYDQGEGVATDSSGDVYVTGATCSFGTGCRNAVLLKFDSQGDLLWQRIWGGTSDDFGRGVSVDSSGDAYVTGVTSSYGAGAWDGLLLKFDPAGNLLWQRTWGTPGYEEGIGDYVDTTGNVYVAGYYNGSAPDTGPSPAILLKFNSTGALMWDYAWVAPAMGSGGDTGLGVTLSPQGDIVMTGGVTEAPPYNQTSPPVQIGTPTVVPITSGNVTGTPSFAVMTPDLALSPASASQTYVKGEAAFTLELVGTTATVSCAPASQFVGKSTTCTATITGSKPFTGTITWSTSGSGKFSPATATCKLSKTKDSCSVKYTPSSADSPATITASYSPSGSSTNPASSGIFSLTVNKATSKATLSCSPSSAKPGKTIKCTATVTGYHPTGIVTWTQSSTNGGSVTFGSPSCTTTTTGLHCTVTMTGDTAGTVTVEAYYPGDTNNFASSKTRNLTIE
jgi:uncharacterized delta-60 repeat protein